MRCDWAGMVRHGPARFDEVRCVKMRFGAAGTVRLGPV